MTELRQLVHELHLARDLVGREFARVALDLLVRVAPSLGTMKDFTVSPRSGSRTPMVAASGSRGAP